MNLHERIRDQLQQMLGHPGCNEAVLNNALRLLAKYRSALIQGTLLQVHGPTVLGGPFAGMDFVEHSAEGCHSPKLLGCYEQQLHPVWMNATRRGYEAVLNIGCAEGYYAVGLARLMKGARVIARDTNAAAQAAVAELARRNGVADRVEIGGLFQPADFAAWEGRKSLVVCDVEGAELDLLQPEIAPALASMDLVVECHEMPGRHVLAELARRFAAMHQMWAIRQQPQAVALPEIFASLGHLDQLLAVWEWRSGPTPWLLLQSRSGPLAKVEPALVTPL